MVETTVPAIEGTELRYNGDTWELTGTVDVRRNGEVLGVRGRKPERVRGKSGTLRFALENPPASINPGNPGEFDADVRRRDGGTFLVVRRPHTNDEYRLESLNYE